MWLPAATLYLHHAKKFKKAIHVSELIPHVAIAASLAVLQSSNFKHWQTEDWL